MAPSEILELSLTDLSWLIAGRKLGIADIVSGFVYFIIAASTQSINQIIIA
jgi:hypothetical protein